MLALTAGAAINCIAVCLTGRSYGITLNVGVLCKLSEFLTAKLAIGLLCTGCLSQCVSESLALCIITNGTGLGCGAGSVYPAMSESLALCNITIGTGLGCGAGSVYPGVTGRLDLLGNYASAIAGIGNSTVLCAGRLRNNYALIPLVLSKLVLYTASAASDPMLVLIVSPLILKVVLLHFTFLGVFIGEGLTVISVLNCIFKSLCASASAVKLSEC